MSDPATFLHQNAARPRESDPGGIIHRLWTRETVDLGEVMMIYNTSGQLELSPYGILER